MKEVSKSLHDEKVADALKHSWVYFLPRWVWPYAQLARWERPIGWQLLMWPCWWSVMLAVIAAQATDTAIPTDSSISLSSSILNLQKLGPVFLLFLMPMAIGSFLMRGAGCTYNDLADVDIDDQVERTRSRPLPSGRISKRQAVVFLALQLLCGLGVLLFLSRFSVFVFWLGAGSLILVAIYPFMKRITWWPQLFLGLAFSWGALMGWAVVWHSLTLSPVLLYLGSILWVIGYDTIYAHQDREDDALVGVKSTARLFGEKSKSAISLLFAGAMILFVAAFWLALPSSQLWAWPAWAGLVLGAIHMFWQISKLDIHNGEQCLKMFKSNSQFGLILFLGLLLSLILAS